MHFFCEKNDFSDALNTVAKAVAVKSTIQILEGIRLEAEDGVIKLAATDLALSIQTSINADVKDKGAVVLPGRMVCEMVRKLPDGPIEVKAISGMVNISYPGSKINLQTLPADEFPELPTINDGDGLELHQSLLRRMITQTIFAVATDESRPILTGCLVEAENDELRLVALDGYRLALRKANLSSPCSPFSAVVPARSFNEVARLLDDSDSPVNLSIKDGHMLVDIGHTQITTRLLEGEFFKYRSTLSGEFTTTSQTPVVPFESPIERASLLAQSKNNQIKFTIEEGHISITANSDMGDFYEEIPSSIDGKNLEIAFNAKYFIDSLKNIDDEYVSLNFNSAVSPCIIKPVDGDAYTYLILPVRLFN